MTGLSRATLGTLVLLTSCSQPTYAALPPSAYPNPKDASEDLVIKVVRVSRQITELNTIRISWDVEVIAVVRDVRRTRTGLQQGSRIVIRYGAHHYMRPMWGGPASLPILARGEIVSAALDVVGDNKDRYYFPGGSPDSTFGPPGKKK
jgi:hypothetical protein